MGTFLTIRNKRTGIKTNIAMQEYSIGLYVIENNDPKKQYGLKCSEEEFINNLKNDENIEIIGE